MRFKCYLEGAEGAEWLRGLEANLEKGLADPRVTQTLAALAARAAAGDEAADTHLAATVERLLAGTVLEESQPEKKNLARKIADALKRATAGISAAAKMGKAAGQNMLQSKVAQVTRSAFQEFALEFMMNFSTEKGATATALSTLGGMVGRRLKSAWQKFRGKIPPTVSPERSVSTE